MIPKMTSMQDYRSVVWKMQLKSTHLIQFKSYFVVRTRDVQIFRRLDIIFQMPKIMFDVSKCSVFETL